MGGASEDFRKDGGSHDKRWGFDSMEALILIDSDDLAQTKIQRGQQRLLLKALLSLTSSREATGSAEGRQMLLYYVIVIKIIISFLLRVYFALLHVAPRKCRLSENIRRRGISSRGNRFEVPNSGSCTRKYMHSDRNFTAPHAINFGTVNYHSELSSTQ